MTSEIHIIAFSLTQMSLDGNVCEIYGIDHSQEPYERSRQHLITLYVIGSTLFIYQVSTLVNA